MLIEVTNSLMADESVGYEVRVKLKNATIVIECVGDDDEAAEELKRVLAEHATSITVIAESRFT